MSVNLLGANQFFTALVAIPHITHNKIVKVFETEVFSAFHFGKKWASYFSSSRFFYTVHSVQTRIATITSQSFCHAIQLIKSKWALFTVCFVMLTEFFKGAHGNNILRSPACYCTCCNAKTFSKAGLAFGMIRCRFSCQIIAWLQASLNICCPVVTSQCTERCKVYNHFQCAGPSFVLRIINSQFPQKKNNFSSIRRG